MVPYKKRQKISKEHAFTQVLKTLDLEWNRQGSMLNPCLLKIFYQKLHQNHKNLVLPCSRRPSCVWQHRWVCRNGVNQTSIEIDFSNSNSCCYMKINIKIIMNVKINFPDIKLMLFWKQNIETIVIHSQSLIENLPKSKQYPRSLSANQGLTVTTGFRILRADSCNVTYRPARSRPCPGTNKSSWIWVGTGDPTHTDTMLSVATVITTALRKLSLQFVIHKLVKIRYIHILNILKVYFQFLLYVKGINSGLRKKDVTPVR